MSLQIIRQRYACRGMIVFKGKLLEAGKATEKNLKDLQNQEYL